MVILRGQDHRGNPGHGRMVQEEDDPYQPETRSGTRGGSRNTECSKGRDHLFPLPLSAALTPQRRTVPRPVAWHAWPIRRPSGRSLPRAARRPGRSTPREPSPVPNRPWSISSAIPTACPSTKGARWADPSSFTLPRKAAGQVSCLAGPLGGQCGVGEFGGWSWLQ